MIVLDILVVAILVLVTVRYAIKGLSGVLLGLISYIVSAVLAWALGSTVGGWLFEKPVAKALGEGDLTEHFLTPKSIAGALGFLAVFIVALIVCKFLTKKFTKLIDIPVVGQLNHLLGGLLGLVLAFLLVQVAVLIVFVPIQLFSFFKEGAQDIMASSHVARWFYEHNLIRALFGFN